MKHTDSLSKAPHKAASARNPQHRAHSCRDTSRPSSSRTSEHAAMAQSSAVVSDGRLQPCLTADATLLATSTILCGDNTH
jgi:hypothetical protein